MGADATVQALLDLENDRLAQQMQAHQDAENDRRYAQLEKLGDTLNVFPYDPQAGKPEPLLAVSVTNSQGQELTYAIEDLVWRLIDYMAAQTEERKQFEALIPGLVADAINAIAPSRRTKRALGLVGR